MARIRQIKPEFWSSLTIAKLPRLTRLHFVALWNYVDDVGRGIDDARLIKAACFPLDDDVDVVEVEWHQAELARQGRIVRYQADDGRRYLEVVNFVEHQYVQKRQTSKLPGPNGASPESSGSPPVAGPDDEAATAPQGEPQAPESPPDQQVQNTTESLPEDAGSPTVDVPPGLGVGGRGQGLGSGDRLLGVRANSGPARGAAHDDDEASTSNPQVNGTTPGRRVLAAAQAVTGSHLHSGPARSVHQAVAKLGPDDLETLVTSLPTLVGGIRGAPQIAERITDWCQHPDARPTPPRPAYGPDTRHWPDCPAACDCGLVADDSGGYRPCATCGGEGRVPPEAP